VGNLGKDPEVRTTQEGQKVVNLSLAVGARAPIATAAQRQRQRQRLPVGISMTMTTSRSDRLREPKRGQKNEEDLLGKCRGGDGRPGRQRSTRHNRDRKQRLRNAPSNHSPLPPR
jgi:single-stranded DNA-binding protein